MRTRSGCVQPGTAIIDDGRAQAIPIDDSGLDVRHATLVLLQVIHLDFGKQIGRCQRVAAAVSDGTVRRQRPLRSLVV